jgi:hypothetical protein
MKVFHNYSSNHIYTKIIQNITLQSCSSFVNSIKQPVHFFSIGVKLLQRLLHILENLISTKICFEIRKSLETLSGSKSDS